ncbi:MAG: FAD-dependent oxidoreductase [Dehalococcoidales bacterium]|nr:FAD-dependent oxidoreductase [Dehalococcoidales bacterium]
MAKNKFEKLLSPIKVGQLTLKNRLVRSTHEARFPTSGGHITQQYIDYYEVRAKGGFGLVNVEAACVDPPRGAHGLDCIRIDDDKYLPGWRELVQGIHKYDCRTFLQLLHYGPWHPGAFTGIQPVAASDVSTMLAPGLKGDSPRALTIAEIGEIIDKYALTAVQARKAGFDGVELNAAGSHLLDTFLSRSYNKRQDAYGCADLKSRSRIVVEIIKAVKKSAGQDFPVSIMMNGMEYGDPDATTVKEAQEFARIFEEAGVDSIEVRFWWAHKTFSMWPDLLYQTVPFEKLPKELDWRHKGATGFSSLAANIKKVVSVPVMSVGGYDAVLGEKVLQEGRADLIVMARRTIADPEYPNKVASGKMEDITPCIGCIYCATRLASDVEDHGGIRCTVNAAVGKEREYEIKEATKKKKVMVVGGGPSGMELARVAALRRHEVMLYEGGRKLGGAMSVASLIKGEKEDLDALIRYFNVQLPKLGVQLKRGVEVTPSLIKEIKPDVLILATGGSYVVPDIPGKDKPIVVNMSDLSRMLKRYLGFFTPKTLRRLTNIWMPIGKKVVIMGGRIHGIQLAGFLADRRRQVTVVDTGSESELGEGMEMERKLTLLVHLNEKGVKLITGAKYEEITDKGLVIIDKEGKKLSIEADTIIPALPLKPNAELLKEAEGEVAEIYSIGSSSNPGLIIDAIADGSRIARVI